MKITTLLGSAKKKGNTATVLGWVQGELESLGHQIEPVYLHPQAIAGCLGCARCKEESDAPACIQNDDAVAILEQMTTSDAVVYASPVYFWGFSAQMKALMDRCYCLAVNYHKPGHTSLMKGKRIALIATGADSYDDNAEGMFVAFDRFAGFLMAQRTGSLYVGPCTQPADIARDFKDKAVDLARALVA